MKKKKTLPADFEEILKQGDVEEIRNILEHCEVDAHKPYEKKTVLFFSDLPEEIIRYLVVERGADINQLSEHKNTALAEHAFSHPEHIPLFITLGADVNYYEGFGSTPLHMVAGFHRVEGVKALLEYGADPSICCGWSKDTAMEHMLKTCRNIDIANAAEIAEMLLKKGVSVTEEMRKEVTRIGTEFEFYRADFATEYLEETESGLQKLYDLFSVNPVPRRQLYDGKSPIVVKAATWQEQHQELWDMLVPGKGHADTIQGEVIRMIGKLCYEILDNGAVNWDNEYKKSVKALEKYLKMGVPVKKDVLLLAKGLGADSTENELYQLTEACVKWVLANPNPMKLDFVDYKR